MYSLYSSIVHSPVRPVLLDTGASACTSPHKDAFVPGTLHKLRTPITLQGIGGGMEITQNGLLYYETLDDNGELLHVNVDGFYAPHMKQSLFSPQVLFHDWERRGFLEVHFDRAVLHYRNQKVTLPLDLQSRLFYLSTFQNVSKAAEELVCSLELTHEKNQNLSQGQKNLLKFHHALIHIGFYTIRRIGKLG